MTGAQGNLSPGLVQTQRRKRDARGGLKRACTGSFMVETTEQPIEPFQQSRQQQFKHRSKSKSLEGFSLEEALSPKLGKPFFDDLEVIDEGVPSTTLHATK